MCEENQISEKLMRINIKQTAKGEPYWDVTARGNSKEEISKLLDEVVEIAKEKIKEIKGDAKASLMMRR